MTATLLAVAGAGWLAGGASAAAPRARVGSVPSLPSAARVTGTVGRAHRVSLTLLLHSRDPLQMQRMATAVSTPGSREYRHYLSVAQFAARFGATATHVAAVQRTLRADGLNVSGVDADHLTLTASGTAARVQAAFATRLVSVRLGDGRRAYADRRTPTLPAAIAGDVDSVVGLNTLTRPESDQIGSPTGNALLAAPRSTRDVVTGGAQPCATAIAAGENANHPGYTADEIADAYNFSGLYGLGDGGAGQSVAVYELEKVNRSDLATYQACYGTHARISYVNTGHPRGNGDDEESGLDIEQVIGLAPDVHVIVYQAPDSATAGLAQFAKIVSQDRAPTVSVSWGSCEARITRFGTDRSIVRLEDKLFQEAALQGQSILSASGDTGSAACYADLHRDGLSVQDPASQPYVTGVGGTTLYTQVNGQNGIWNPADPTEPALQSVWNDGVIATPTGGEAAATTGGLSSLWSMPRYQRKATPGLGVINADSSGHPCHSSHDCREIPDVSADGDPASGYVVRVRAPGQGPMWTVEGGTSAAAPLWAALTAEADALSTCRGAALGFENPSLYYLAAAQPTDFSDISAASPLTGRANNDAIGKNRGLYPATAGYDMTTGLGTPNAAGIASGLCALRAPVYTVTLAAPSHDKLLVHHKIRLRIRGSDSGRLALRFRARGLPRALKISRGGVISGTAKRTGAYRVTVSAVDHATNRGRVHFGITVLASPAKVDGVSVSGVARRHPTLAFTVTRGRYGADVHAITIRVPDGLRFGRRGRGIHIRAGAHRVHFNVTHLASGVKITLSRAQPRIRVTIRRPSLLATKSLASTARHHHSAKVKVRINITDRHRRTTKRSFRLALAH